jgi:AraC-like DNA-binding protein
MNEPPIDDGILNLIRELLDGSTEDVKRFHQAVVRSVVYLAECYQENIHLQDIMATAHVSRSHLCQLFQEEVGVSPMKFLTLLRVEASKRVLTDQWQNVNYAWEVSGFGDLRTYEREFKRWVGCTPSEYRKLMRAKSKRPRVQDE